MKVSDGTIDLESLRSEMKHRKIMLKSIKKGMKSIKESLSMTNTLKERALGKLIDQSSRYQSLILCNIVLIQRWWRGLTTKLFFKTLLRKDLMRWKEKHARKIFQMELNVAN